MRSDKIRDQKRGTLQALKFPDGEREEGFPSNILPASEQQFQE